MGEVVVVEAVRSAFGRRNGALAGLHAAALLGAVQRAAIERAGIDPAEVELVIGGCVGQVGMQAQNVTRTAWLAAGLPQAVPATTLDTQCGSSQEATNLAYGMVASGVVEVALACGVELMSGVPIGSAVPAHPDVGIPEPPSYADHHEWTDQFEGSERLAEKYGVTREDCDRFGKQSQDRAARAWDEGRFDSQIIPLGDHVRDEGLRESSLEKMATLKPTGRPDGAHTAATSSQIADGASAVLLMSRQMAEATGCRPLATIVDVALVGCDPVLMLEGPIPATRKLLGDNGMTISDLDVMEINEAFAAVVLGWARELGPDMERVNPNGGAIAMGHPLGATGGALLAKAVHELDRIDGEHALVAMCCGGGLGTGTLLRRA